MRTTHRSNPLRTAQRRFLTVWLVPLLACFVLFRIWPLLYGLYISFFDWDVFSPTHTFRGLMNYAEELGSPMFTTLLANTSYFALASTLLCLVVGYVVAVLLNNVVRFKSLFRTLFYLPNMTSMIAVSIVWMWLYQPQFGLFNATLRGLGLPALSWLKSPDTAMPSIIAMSVWSSVGYPIIVLLAGLQSIPREFYEAATVDGASGARLFRSITFPLMKPVTLFVTVTGFMNGFQVFQQIYVMTQGGPLNSTAVFAYRIFQLGFSQLKFGRAASLAFIVFGLVLALTIAQLRMGRTTTSY
jgi:multiple sugar transport system permease protein